ncbi:MAG: hypothetical protein AAGD04_14420 [Pseudomonadota bacterium]
MSIFNQGQRKLNYSISKIKLRDLPVTPEELMLQPKSRVWDPLRAAALDAIGHSRR